MSLFNWPFTRKSYAGIENPIYVSDTQAATEAAIQAVKALAGLNNTDFAIISGLDYTAGVPNTYTSGIYYLNGVFYFQQAVFNEGFYLTSNFTDELLESFTDGTPRYIYTVQYSTTSASPTGNTPAFSGSMDPYRIGSKYVSSAVLALQAIANSLGGAAFLNIGTSAGTVAAGNDSRLVYNQSQFDSLFLGKSPSIIGEVKQIYDTPGTFSTNFDGSGIGIVAPWIGWALMDGQGGRPDMTGTVLVGVGTSFVSKVPGGANTQTLITANLPPHTHDRGFISGASVIPNGGSGEHLILGTAQTGSTGSGTAFSILQKYIPVYMVIRIS